MGQLSLLLLCLLIPASVLDSYNILFMPLSWGFNSRVINQIKMAEMLHEDGHTVTILTNSNTWPHIKTIVPDVIVNPVSKEEHVETTDESFLSAMMDLKSLVTLNSFITYWRGVTSKYCEDLLQKENIIQELEKRHFHLAIYDSGDYCGRLIKDHLQVPGMLQSNYGFSIFLETNTPFMASFMCTGDSFQCQNDDMTFSERFWNFLSTAMIRYHCNRQSQDLFLQLGRKYLKGDFPSINKMPEENIVVATVDWALDYPAPVMPNFLPISFMFLKDARPLPPDLEQFIQNSSPHGVVVISFGTLFDQFSPDKVKMLTQVFNQLPYSFIWRNNGKPVEGLGNNTKQVGWFPQSDVLAHPLVRLFITHCGVSATYEAAINAIPVIAAPIFWDQDRNCNKLVHRAKMGQWVDFKTVSGTHLQKVIVEVITNRKYKDNAIRTSALIKDQPVPPKEKFLYYVNYTIHHKGARHLASQVAYSMNTFQFYMIDIFAFFLGCFMFVATILVFVVRKSLAYFR